MKKLLPALLAMSVLLGCISYTGMPVMAAETEGTEVLEWEYELYGEGVKLTAFNDSAATDVYVPSSIEVGGTAYAVIKLGDSIFADNAAINSVTIGAGISEIGESAFANATNLVCVVMPESLTTIGSNAFAGCTSLNSIIL